jgi:hypothetical protein
MIGCGVAAGAQALSRSAINIRQDSNLRDIVSFSLNIEVAQRKAPCRTDKGQAVNW